MRCPKCGYISFDHLESCKKCRKNISEASAGLDGTVFDAPSPIFLHLEAEKVGPKPSGTKRDKRVEESEPMVDFSFEEDALGAENELILDYAEEEKEGGLNLSTDLDEESTLEFENSEEMVLGDEITLDLEGEEEFEASESDKLQLDFTDIDISDLAPPDEYDDEEGAEALTLDDDLLSAGAMTGGAPPSSVTVAPGSGLEDLQVDGLDLDAPAAPVIGSKMGKKFMPSVKTGTALDNFEFDLGELASDK